MTKLMRKMLLSVAPFMIPVPARIAKGVAVPSPTGVGVAPAGPPVTNTDPTTRPMRASALRSA